MIVDFLNCLIEFSSFLFIFLMFRPRAAARSGIICYSVLSLSASCFFVLVPLQSLLFNMLVFCGIACISFRKFHFGENLCLSLISFLGIVALQFTLYAFLPVDFLQTGPGNLAGNIAMLLISGILLLNVKNHSLADPLAGFVLRFRVILLSVLLGFLILGQVYLSRLTEIWSYLPGLISLLVLSLLAVSAAAYIRYQRSAELLEARAFRQSMKSSQDLLAAMRVQLHDYKHHLNHIRDMITTADDLSVLKYETGSYIDQLYKDRSTYEMLLALDNTVIRAFLFGCLRRCEAYGIPLFLDTSAMLPEFPLKDYQFIEVADNLFCNALEHNLTLDGERRYIRMTLSSEEDVQLFSVENPADNISLPLESLYIANMTTKTGGHQGLGLPSIRRTLADNNIRFSGTRDYERGCVIFSVIYQKGSRP